MSITNVMQVVHDLDIGGMQRVVVDLCSHIDPSKFKMTVCCLHGLGELSKELESLGIPVFFVKKNPGIDYTLPIRLRKLFLNHSIQIIHTHGVNPFFYGTIGATLARVPAIIHTDHARGIFPVSKKEMVSEKVLSFFADRIVAVSDAVKRDLFHYAHITPEKLHVIYNGIDPTKYRTTIDQKKKRAKLGIGKDDIVIGVGVRLSEQKGIGYLIQAVGQLAQSFSNLKLLIVGDGELRGDLEGLSAECGIADKVIFTGFRSDIPEILQLIDIYALPSIWEGHPLALLEAMAASKPIVASNIPGNREVVSHGQSGLLFTAKNSSELANALSTLIENERLRNAMGLMGHKILLEGFTLEKTINQYQNLYEQYLAI